jgi:hypothetical protein
VANGVTDHNNTLRVAHISRGIFERELAVEPEKVNGRAPG